MVLQMHDFLRAISENDPKAEEEYAEFKALHTASAKRSMEVTMPILFSELGLKFL